MFIISHFKALSLDLNYSTHFADQETWLRWTKGQTRVTGLISYGTRIKIWLSYLLWASFVGGNGILLSMQGLYTSLWDFLMQKKRYHSTKCLGAAVRNWLSGRVHYWYTLFHITYGFTELKDILRQKDLKSPFNRI